MSMSNTRVGYDEAERNFADLLDVPLEVLPDGSRRRELALLALAGCNVSVRHAQDGAWVLRVAGRDHTFAEWLALPSTSTIIRYLLGPDNQAK